ncbi:hypothetical protein ACIBG8_23765 [Nonomuraea sp. NPDC050556]|uniref:hypothetical protein n=1 Tax=Nonomuraea sp. NPDC050556 TaxID=3364369 RepID=UPI0037B5B381
MSEVEIEIRRGVDTRAWGLRLGIRALRENAVLLGVRDPEADAPEVLTLHVGDVAEVAGRRFSVLEIRPDSVIVK